MLIEKLHRQSADYIRDIGEGGERLVVIRDKLDATLHNLFYLLKMVRAKYEVRWTDQAKIDLQRIYEEETRRRNEDVKNKAQKLEALLEKGK